MKYALQNSFFSSHHIFDLKNPGEIFPSRSFGLQKLLLTLESPSEARPLGKLTKSSEARFAVKATVISLYRHSAFMLMKALRHDHAITSGF